MTTLKATALALALTASTASGSGLMQVSGSSYNPFVSAMDMMMDAMDRYSRNRAWEDTLSGSTWQSQPWTWAAGGMPGMSPQMPGQDQMRQMIQKVPQPGRSWGATAGQMLQPQQTTGAPSPTTAQSVPRAAFGALDGAWQGSSGEVLILRSGLFRLYAGRDRYHDGRISLRGNLAIMTDPSSGVSRSYEYAESQGRLAFRDDEGHLLLYRKLPDSTIRNLLSSP